MSIAKVAYRYADSFLKDVVDKGVLKEVSKDLDFLIITINSNEKLKKFLSSPVIKSEHKKTVLKEIFLNKISSHSLKFIEFVVDKKREDVLLNILIKFNELKDDFLGIVRLEVKSAFELDEELKDLLLKNFEKIFNKKVEAQFIVEKSLIGGFVVKIKDTIYDASIFHQLEKLKNNLISGSLSLN